jgi:cathepsin A (carboxypeptidase C)
LARSNVCKLGLFYFSNTDLLTELGLNMYDVRRTCDRQKDGPLCYKGLEWVEAWMNDATIKKELGVNPSLTFQSCNMRVNQDFTAQADGMRNSALLLTDLVNEGIRLLVYAGNAGMWLIVIRFVGVC